jgi:hypothetical protein
MRKTPWVVSVQYRRATSLVEYFEPHGIATKVGTTGCPMFDEEASLTITQPE